MGRGRSGRQSSDKQRSMRVREEGRGGRRQEGKEAWHRQQEWGQPSIMCLVALDARMSKANSVFRFCLAFG